METKLKPVKYSIGYDDGDGDKATCALSVVMSDDSVRLVAMLEGEDATLLYEAIQKRPQPEAVTNAGDVKEWEAKWYGSPPMKGARVCCDREILFYVGEDKEHLQLAREICVLHNKMATRTATAEADLAKAKSVIAERDATILEAMKGIRDRAQLMMTGQISQLQSIVSLCGTIETALQTARKFMGGK